MREKLEWLKLIIPGFILTGLVVTQVLGAGPDLQEIPDRLIVQNEDTEKVDVPVTSTKPEAENTQKEKKEKKKAEKLSYNGPENGYKDGTYYGSATGYGGTIQVAVTIQDGKLTAVKIVSAASETPEFFARAKAVADRSVSAQIPNVDVVSGATYSSNGIINAVINALKQAGATGLANKSTTKASKPTVTRKPGPTKKPSNKKTVPKDATYADGTFYGSGEGYGGSIKVKVVIKKEKIKEITIVSSAYETPEYFAKAKTILAVMKKKQTAEVDVVSGATYSSNGIIDAVREALNRSIEKQKEKAGKHKATPKPKPTVAPTKKPQPTSSTTEDTTEDGTKVVEKVTNYEKQVTGNATCYPDEDEDFRSYPISLLVNITGQKLTRTTTKDGQDTVEETNTYKVDTITFTEETKTLAAREGNWFYLKRAADGFGKYKGVFGQLLLPKEVGQVDVVSSATCSSVAILDAYKNAIEQIEK